jgi:chitodextrinase
VPQGLEATPSRNSIVLSWQPAEDNAGIKRYTAYLDGQAYKRTTTCTCTFQGLEPNTEYLLEVEAEDQAGNKSDKAALRVSTLNTALELIDASDPSEPQEVYTLDGRFVGHTVPRTGGPFIVKKKQKTMIFIN